MKKLAFFVAAIALLMAGCNDDFEDDLNELRDKVDDLEKALVTGLEFQENNLVVIFSDGTTSQVTVPEEILPGNVVDFDIDNESGIIVITFADGTTKEYLILNNGDATYLSGTLEGDYGIASMTLGDVEMVNLEYDDQNSRLSIGVYNLYHNSNPYFLYFTIEEISSQDTRVMPQKMSVFPFTPFLNLKIQWR